MKLQGKIALVTGAADGIGFAIAERFVTEGARVFLSDVDEAKCQAKVDQLGEQASAARCDVASSQEVKEWVQSILADAGTPSILVNNAAISLGGEITTMSDEDWNRVLNTNLSSVFRCIRAVLPHMLKAGQGSIINLSSVQAKRSFAGWTAYATAKGGILAMTQQLAGQYGAKGIRVNALSPGAIQTPMNVRRAAEEGEHVKSYWARMHAMERMGLPEEVAAAALFLASDEASFVTGQDLAVEGGLYTTPRYLEIDN